MKSQKLIGAQAGMALLLLTNACSANSSSTPLQNASAAKEQKTVKTFDCRNANEYRFDVVGNESRKKDSDPVIPKDLNIAVGDETVAKIELPKESEAKNFSLNTVTKTSDGFEVKIDWGGGVYHYEVQFNFRCKDNNFYLYEVKRKDLSTTNPDSGNFLDKQESKTTKIEPNLPIEKFVMIEYLNQ